MRSRSASRSVLGWVIGTFLPEGVVAGEGVRLDDEVVDARVAGERQSNRRLLVAVGAGLVEQLSDGTEVGCLACERGGDGVIELGRREPLEQLAQAQGVSVLRRSTGTRSSDAPRTPTLV